MAGATASIYFRSVRLDGVALQNSALVERLAADRQAPSFGPADASVSLIVFTDYRCPACRTAHPAMLAAAAADGDTRIVFRDFPIFGPVSDDAARVALAMQGQGLYSQTHDAFMRGGGDFSARAMKTLVEDTGGDWERALAAIEGGGPGTQLAANQRDALLLGIRGTPTYVIGRHRYTGALSQTQFARAIERARRER